MRDARGIVAQLWHRLTRGRACVYFRACMHTVVFKFVHSPGSLVFRGLCRVWFIRDGHTHTVHSCNPQIPKTLISCTCLLVCVCIYNYHSPPTCVFERVLGGKEKGVLQGQWEKKLRGSQLISLCGPGACNCILPCIHLCMYTRYTPHNAKYLISLI